MSWRRSMIRCAGSQNATLRKLERKPRARDGARAHDQPSAHLLIAFEHERPGAVAEPARPSGERVERPATGNRQRGTQDEHALVLDDDHVEPCLVIGPRRDSIADVEVLQLPRDLLGARNPGVVEAVVAVPAAAAEPHLHEPRPDSPAGRIDRDRHRRASARVGDDLVAGKRASNLILGRAEVSQPRTADGRHGSACTERKDREADGSSHDRMLARQGRPGIGDDAQPRCGKARMYRTRRTRQGRGRSGVP